MHNCFLMFITMFSRIRHVSLYWISFIYFTPLQPISLRTTQALPWRLCIDLPSGLFLSGFPARTLFAFLITPVRATCPACFILLHLFTVIVFSEEYKSCSSWFFCLLQLPHTYIVSVSSDIFLSTTFANTFTPCCSLDVRDQVSRI